MENFKNIIRLLNSPQTMEVGAMLAVSQGMDRKALALYERKGHKTMNNLNKNLRIEKKSNKQYLKIIEYFSNSYSKYLRVQISILDAMHDKEVADLVEKGLMKEDERLPF